MDSNILEKIDSYQLGKELQQARNRKGLTQEEAAKVIDVARTTLVAIEKGERRLKPIELIKLAKAYGQQISDFVRPRPVLEPVRPQFRRSLQASTDDPALDTALNNLEDLCRDYLELEQLTNSPIVSRYPAEYNIEGQNIDRAAEFVALEERSRLGLGDGPIPALRDVLEQEVGLRIFYIYMPSKFSAMYFYNEQLGGCIGINSAHAKAHVRQRWSLAHEYGHFLAHRSHALIENESKRQPDTEKFANSFAQFFLMFSTGIIRRYNKTVQVKKDFTISDLRDFANYYKVSLDALTQRLEDLKLVPLGTLESLKDNWKQIRAIQKELDQKTSQTTQNPEEPMIPNRYKYLAMEALYEGLISEGQFARFMRVDRAEGVLIATLPGQTEFTDLKSDNDISLLQSGND
ncbi:MAG: helix-turn-helix domain-containing protein [Chloroflexi bacterium]|nr:helix-turn-helix domain-containing protein [Chloroflexota bacterium]